MQEIMKDPKDKYNNQENMPHGNRMMPVDPERRDEDAFMNENNQRNVEARNDNLHPSANIPHNSDDSGAGSDNPQGKVQSPKDVPGSHHTSQDFNSSTSLDINEGSDSRSRDESLNPSLSGPNSSKQDASSDMDRIDSDVRNKARGEGPYGVQEPGHGSDSMDKEDR
jgi:hypothetical protein